ncbi:hypothetical protein WA026_003528 [Henosepilachna vigintioctopunctata]|uniref:Uncharacterized protein n=1 Tax=Henosepilachna vigintioctopunctata TaxID=420089 RepID=A0AAW1TNQ8_9CUCU
MDDKSGNIKKPNPRETATFLSSLFFFWTLPLFIKGSKRDLTEDDLYEPLRVHKSHQLGKKLERAWMKQLKRKRKSLIRALWSVFKMEICGYILLNFFLVFTPKLGQPILLMQILNYYIPGQTNISQNEAAFYVAAIIVVLFIGSISGHTYVMGMQQLGIKLRVAICSLLYRKTLRLSKFAMNDTSTGQIITLLSNDVRMFDYVMLEFSLLVIAPTELFADTILLYFLLGKTALVGIAFLILFIPLQMYNGKLSANYRLKIAQKTDIRILLMNEIISGIEVIKMYTWEKPFAKLVEVVRRLEVQQIRGAAYVNAFLHSYNMFMSRTAQFLCILTFVLTGQTPVAQYVFVLTSFYNNLAKTVSVNFPDAISTFAEAMVSCKRIEGYLSLGEIHHSKLSSDEPNSKDELHHIEENTKVVVKMCNVAAHWNTNGESESSLIDLNLELKSKSKVAVIGPVGSGKSTLINIILQELPVSQGSVKVNGTVSYAAQEPWLFKGSIRQNILFGQVMDYTKYKEVVKVCALEKDFDTFPFRDLSLIGEKGVTLSGGQKARISLARAVYRDADLYLLDDPLSAVDTHVGKQLYEQCISRYLSEKCVVLVTHQLQYLSNMDTIYIMENGRILQTGTYQELQNSNSSFIRFLSHNIEHDGGEDSFSERDNQDDKLESYLDGPKDVKELMSTGALSNSVYIQYFKSGGRWFVYIPVFMLFFLTQICASTGDYFITFWVNLEQSRAATIEKSNSANGSSTTPEYPKNKFLGETYDFYQTIFNSQLCIYVYTSIICFLILIALSRSIAFFQYCLSSSTFLHNNMFVKIVKAPMRFFNTNPSGRILNRFSKDIGSIDEVLPVLLLESIEVSQ